MADEDYREPLALARRLAVEAGAIILEHQGGAAVRRKADGSEVTDADLAAERHILGAIRSRYPDHAQLAEESGAGSEAVTSAEYCWVVDPLDGTRNYTRGFPCFATSIALLREGQPVVGVIREHTTGHVYAAAASSDVTKDGRVIRVAQRKLGRSFIVGVPRIHQNESPTTIQRLLDRVNVRGTGSTALNLALVASGALDAAFARRCHSWDIAAGYLLVHRAGGVCTSLSGGPLWPMPAEVDPTGRTPFLAAGPHAHAALLDLLGDASDPGGT
ncbi:MAG: inositol monophosphatase [bacterium]|nr:inositol monophosphatase [bacterium]